MKKILIILYIITLNTSAQDVQKNIDKNLSEALKIFEKYKQDLKNTKDQNDELILKLLKSSLCLMVLNKESSHETVNNSLQDFQIDPKTNEKIKNFVKNKENEMKFQMLFLSVENPESLCEFKINKSPLSNSVKSQEDKDIEKKYNAIMNSKKTIHPVFLKLITDIESKKKYMSRSNYRIIEFKNDNYFQNFLSVYEFESKYVEEKSLYKMTLFSHACIESIKKAYNSQCHGKPRYLPIKGLITKYLLCADENQNKLDKSCQYTQTFQKISS